MCGRAAVQMAEKHPSSCPRCFTRAGWGRAARSHALGRTAEAAARLRRSAAGEHEGPDEGGWPQGRDEVEPDDDAEVFDAPDQADDAGQEEHKAEPAEQHGQIGGAVAYRVHDVPPAPKSHTNRPDGRVWRVEGERTCDCAAWPGPLA